MTTNDLVHKAYADLAIKSIMFDIDIDIETWSLIPKRKNTVSIWMTKWREKEQTSDRQPNDYEGGSDERR